jgi:hypothetical protein
LELANEAGEGSNHEPYEGCGCVKFGDVIRYCSATNILTIVTGILVNKLAKIINQL